MQFKNIKKINNIKENILNFLFPNKCGFCNKICIDSICKKCENKIKEYETRNKIIKIKNNKKDKNYYLSNLITIFKYENIIREKIIEYKFIDKPYLYLTFAKTILKNKKICGFLKKYDIIIPIPINKKRKQERKYNQSELIAKKISENIDNLIFNNNILLKIKDIIPQSKLTKLKRIENVKGAFDINKKQLKNILNKKIILFDDIYTTGSTANECAKILLINGAKKVDILTIAKD